MGVDDLGTWRTADEMKLEESIEEKPFFQLVFYLCLHCCFISCCGSVSR